MRKIMFNDRYGLTQAGLDGRKTQTRRIVPRSFFTCTHDILDNNALVCEDEYGDWHDIRETRYALQVGEVVAVAQRYSDFMEADKVLYRTVKEVDGYRREMTSEQKGWNNKLFVCADLMPHRIRITDVRVERLNDISESDCIAEGIYLHTDGYYSFPNSKMGYDTPREAYAALIDKISGKGVWSSNPYVFVYEFELVK